MDYSRSVCAYRIFKYKTMNINAQMKKCTVSKTLIKIFHKFMLQWANKQIIVTFWRVSL